MKFKIIEGGLELSEEERFVQKEMQEFEWLLKRLLLGSTINNKIVDISCFYDISIDELIQIVNQIRSD